MAFLNRLFNRKSKAEFISAPQLILRRSLTDPNPPLSLFPQKSRRSSSDDKDMVEVLPPPRRAPRVRRAGCEFGRAKTSIEIGSVRSSNSSATDPVSTSADGAKSKYRQLRALHRSRLHTIMAAQDRSSKHAVVMKTFYKARLTSALRAKLESEVVHLRMLAGVPGVVKFIDQFEDDECIYVVLERCAGTTLIELAANSGGRLTEQSLVPDVLIPLTLTLADLHRRGIVYRHLKPEHVLCSAEHGTVTLVDFAEAANKKQRCLNNRAGTLEYMAPEVLDKPTAEEVFHQVLYNGMSEEELPQYDEKADVWSLGVLAYEALTGCQPFLADNPQDMSHLQRELLSETTDKLGGPRLLADKPQLSAEARSFLQQTLQLNPLNRLSAERLLQHPLIQRYWGRYQSRQSAAGGGRARGVGGAIGGGNTSGAVTSLGPGPRPSAATGLTFPPSAAVAADGSTTGITTTMRSTGPGPCVMPSTATAVGKAGVLVTAPMQFPVR